MTNRWLLLHFDIIGGAGVFLTTLFSLSGFVSAGIVSSWAVIYIVHSPQILFKGWTVYHVCIIIYHIHVLGLSVRFRFLTRHNTNMPNLRFWTSLEQDLKFVS